MAILLIKMQALRQTAPGLDYDSRGLTAVFPISREATVLRVLRTSMISEKKTDMNKPKENSKRTVQKLRHRKVDHPENYYLHLDRPSNCLRLQGPQILIPFPRNQQRTPNQTTQSIPSPHSPFRTESPRTTRPGSFMTPTAQRNRDQRMEELSLSDDEDNSATHRTSATKTAHYHSSEKERETRRARSEASRNPLQTQGDPFQHGARLAAMMKHREREPVQNEVNKDNPALHRNHETPGDENKFDAPTPSQNAGDTEYDPFQQPSFDGNPSAPMNVTRNSPSVSIERPQRMDQLSALNRGEPLKVP